MCGRFSLAIEPDDLRALDVDPPERLEARYNIYPDSEILAVRARKDGTRSAGFVRWGLLPPWSRDVNDKGRQINARSETFLTKPTFEEAGLRYRCLIPATGFFEWQKGKGGSQPYRIAREDGGLILFAGLFRPTKLDDGAVVATAAILTEDAHESIRAIHHRMPVMLSDAATAMWLDPARDTPEAVQAALVSLPEDAIVAHPVDRAVNDPANEGAGLVRPVEAIETAPAQGDLL